MSRSSPRAERNIDGLIVGDQNGENAWKGLRNSYDGIDDQNGLPLQCRKCKKLLIRRL